MQWRKLLLLSAACLLLTGCGHKHVWETAQKAASCSEDGYQYQYCTVCNAITDKKTLPATGHTFTTERTEPTCTQEGAERILCSSCGQIESETAIPAQGHKISTDSKAAACEADGYRNEICSVCGEVLSSEILPAMGHDYTVTQTAATCTEPGYSIQACTRCGQVLESREISPALGHSWILSKETAKTCSYVCSRCGETETRHNDQAAEAGSDESEFLVAAQNVGRTLTESKGIHDYSVYFEDVTWEQAFQRARDMGGYLVQINSQEELDFLLSNLESYSKYVFLIGGRRDAGANEYYWVNEDNCFVGTPLNASDAWCGSLWLTNEPSFASDGKEECCLEMFHYAAEDRWVINDAPNDVTGYYPGKIGYIVEFED